MSEPPPRAPFDEHWFATALMSIGDGVIATDGAARLIFLNPIAESLTGWTSQDAFGRPIGEVFQIVNEFTREPVEDPVVKVIADGRGVTLANHTILISRDGREFPIDDAAAPIAVGTDDLSGVILVFRDVTEKRRFELSTRRLAAIIESSDDIIATKDLDGIITGWNRGAEQVLGYTAEEIVGRHVSVLMPPSVSEDTGWILGRIRRGEKVDHYQTKRRHKDGAVIDVSLTVSPIRDDSGRIIGASKVGRDITEMKRVEAERAQADRRKDRFLSMLGHELRNPVAAIRMAVELLDRPCDAAQLAEAREILRRQTSTLARLVDDLIDVSRITRGVIEIRKVPLDLPIVIEHAIGTVRVLLQDRRHSLTLEFDPKLPQVEGDPVRLEQVFANLFSNSCKYTPPGGRIRISAAAEGGKVLTRVTDDGAGIDPADLPHIFDLFTQGARTLNLSDGGLGVGLTVVRELVERHGGRVAARSEGRGKGSEFVVELPAIRSGSAVAERIDPGFPHTDKARILIVDDNKDLARSTGQILKLMGHDVELAYDGPEGIEVAQAYRPEVVLLDIGLPSMDGYEVARRLRGESALYDALILAISGYAQEDDRRRSLEAGMDEHLPKPIDLGRLAELIHGRSRH